MCSTQKCRLTIFTATFNRGHLLPNLYKSLCNQTKFNFEWLIIDDGSTDQTEQLVDNWLKHPNPFPIRYYKQENKGLIRSFNRGIELACGEYLSKIDSDDYVVNDFCESILDWIDSISSNPNLYGVSGLRVDSNGKPLKGIAPSIPSSPGYVDASDLERQKYNLNADMSEAWNVEILRQHPFPVWDNEKFAPEQIVFFDIALEGKTIRWYPKPLTICEYQDDGLTKGASKLEKENPMGYAMMYNQRLKYEKGFLNRINIASQMIALSIVGNCFGYILKSNGLVITLLSLAPGLFLSFRRKKQYKSI